MGKLVTDNTMQQVLAELKSQNALLQVLANDKITHIDLATLKRLGRTGQARKILNIGDQVVVNWTDTATGKEYEVPLNIVHCGTAELENGDVVDGIYLQWAYAMPFDVQFDNYEAFYVASEELSAGTYNVKIGANWGNNCKEDAVYSFTLTQPLPVGGQLTGFYRIPDVQASELKVYSYASSTATTPIETVATRVGEEGTNLGTLIPAGNELNSLHRVGYGYNRWSQSAIRQWLNSSAASGAWWSPQNDYDRPPSQLTTKAGFLTGVPEELLDCVEKIKITTGLNTVIPADKETANDVTYDRFWLPSNEQMFIKPDSQGEGETFEYWRKASGRTSPCEWWKTYPNMITYAVDNHKSAQSVRLRSAYRGNASGAWYVYSSGSVSHSDSAWSIRCAPVCFI